MRDINFWQLAGVVLLVYFVLPLGVVVIEALARRFGVHDRDEENE